MARYIDADEVLNAMDTWPKYGIKPDGRFIMLNKETENDYVPYVHYEDMLKVVNGTPTAFVKNTTPIMERRIKMNVDTLMKSFKIVSAILGGIAGVYGAIKEPKDE